MKHINRTCNFIPAYPNEAHPSYFSHKILDGITSVVTGMGVLAIFFYLITL